MPTEVAVLPSSSQEAERLECGCEPGSTCHYPCCHDDDLACCGEDITDDEWCLDPDNCKADECVVCGSLYANEMAIGQLCTCLCCR